MAQDELITNGLEAAGFPLDAYLKAKNELIRLTRRDAKNLTEDEINKLTDLIERNAEGDYRLKMLDSTGRGGLVGSTAIEKLDQLLEFYRSSPRAGGCTTQELVSLRWKRGDRTVGHEMFLNSSCDRTFRSTLRYQSDLR